MGNRAGAVVAVTDTFAVSPERGRFRQRLAGSRAPSFWGRRLFATTATSEARDSSCLAKVVVGRAHATPEPFAAEAVLSDPGSIYLEAGRCWGFFFFFCWVKGQEGVK